MAHIEGGVNLTRAVRFLVVFGVMQVTIGCDGPGDGDRDLGFGQPRGLEIGDGTAEAVYFLWAAKWKSQG